MTGTALALAGALFYDRLRRIGHSGRIGLEARSTDLTTEASRAMAFLRRALGP